MQLEFHQLDRRWEHLRTRHPPRTAAVAGLAGRNRAADAQRGGGHRRLGGPLLVIDGYKRLAALQQMVRDTVEAVVWPMSAAEALVLDRSLRWSEHESALEQGQLGGAVVLGDADDRRGVNLLRPQAGHLSGLCKKPASLAVALKRGIGSSSLKAEVKAFDRLHIVRG
jgi:hypothetical protein